MTLVDYYLADPRLILIPIERLAALRERLRSGALPSRVRRVPLRAWRSDGALGRDHADSAPQRGLVARAQRRRVCGLHDGGRALRAAGCRGFSCRRPRAAVAP